MRFIFAATTAAALLRSCAGLTLDIPTATAIVAVVDILPHPAQITGGGAALELRDRDGGHHGHGNWTGNDDNGFNKTCARSVYSRAFSRSIPNEELSSALRSSLSVSGASSRPWRGDLCTVTLASSLSSDYMSYLGQARSKYTSATDYLKSVHTDCGGPVFQVSVRPVCTKSSLTAVFTGTSGSPKTTVLPAVPPNNGVSIDVKTGNVSMINLLADDDKGSAASGLGRGRALGSVVTLAAAAGVALML
ncbi:hypothetical protein LEL_08014 [Akanthomyces lecanii RCEF 1005]|uniref:Uncharacterized protein n=1 Tax=Akanthomyces lecanii RCEF 1005 TaxID=1081108 RepID=A0A168EZ47_CORDF|nr:hypothetical protein LEL_08014 [Akanthomyces lecanii RCEF 1005]